MALRITFHGAAQTVTGSRYLIETDQHEVLVDCGLFQGGKALRLKNWDRPHFDPYNLDAIVLTHAHIDHTGYLPAVVNQGFDGPIYCTAATQELLNLLLLDSAHLQEEEARYANKYGTSKHHPAKPLYTQADAKRALSQLKVIPRGQSTEIVRGLRVTPSCAGHILGATSMNFDYGGKRVTFSGDIGRFDAPLLPDPQPLAIGDLLICESTYGNREHPDIDVRQQLAQVINDALPNKGPILIPAFALGRTQDLLYLLSELERNGKIPVVPVFVDSPMAVDATAIYRRYQNDYDEEAAKVIASGKAPLLTRLTAFAHTTDQSKQLNFLEGSRIIISASGMVNGGRIMHHMMHHLPDEKTTVLFVGYQAEETRGRTILRGEKTVRIFGSEVPIRAQVKEMGSLSAHGDRSELLRWLKSCSGTPASVKITHGEPEPSRAFADTLRHEFQWKAEPAKFLEMVEV